jgi:nicotinate-nucleotide adenylyltransferase
MALTQNVGLYGGAFDPPHRTHVELARRFIEQASLGALHICPTAGAWHKQRTLSGANHRMNLCHLAFGDLPGVCIDAREIERGGPTYTVDTLESLHTEYPQASLHLLIGRDQFERLHTWHALERIETLATLHVADRAGEATPMSLPAQYQPLRGTPTADSATVVRERRQAGQPIDDLVTPAVARYIANSSLYL